MPLPDQVIEGHSVESLRSMGGAAAFYSNLGMANAVQMQHLQAQEALAEARAMGIARLNAVHAGSRHVYELSPDESRSQSHMLTEDAVAQKSASILGSLNSGQQGVKSAGNTPPVTP